MGSVNPWGGLIVALGIALVFVGWKGSYNKVWEFFTGNVQQSSSSDQTKNMSQTSGSSGAVTSGVPSTSAGLPPGTVLA